MQGWVTLTWLLLLLQVLTCHGLGGYPGTFYQIMLRLNKERKNARTAPSPNRLWVILDPAASLGSLSREPLNSNRIIRSASFRIPELEEVQEEWTPEKVFPQEEPLTELREEWNPKTGLHGEVLATETVITEEWNISTASPQEGPVTEAALTEQQQQQEEEEVTQTDVLVEGGTQTDLEVDQWTTEVSTRDANREPESCGGEVWMTTIPGNNTIVEEGSKHQQVLVTPGWYDGRYPHNLDCVWNLNVGTECQAGLLLYKVLEGQVRETNRCLQDYLQVLQPNGFSAKYCGPLVNKGKAVSGTDAWSKAEPRTTILRFKSSPRTDQSLTDLLPTTNLPRGFRMEVTYYCWIRSKYVLQPGATRGTGTTGEDTDTTGEESGTTGEDSGTTGGDTGTTVSYDDTYGTTVDDSGSAERNDSTSNTIGVDTGTIEDDSGTNGRDVSTSGTSVSDTGTTGNDVISK
ncbi:uncharacterized protein [Cherax quadricarinatus]